MVWESGRSTSHSRPCSTARATCASTSRWSRRRCLWFPPRCRLRSSRPGGRPSASSSSPLPLSTLFHQRQACCRRGWWNLGISTRWSCTVMRCPTASGPRRRCTSSVFPTPTPSPRRSQSTSSCRHVRPKAWKATSFVPPSSVPLGQRRAQAGPATSPRRSWRVPCCWPSEASVSSEALHTLAQQFRWTWWQAQSWRPWQAAAVRRTPRQPSSRTPGSGTRRWTPRRPIGSLPSGLSWSGSSRSWPCGGTFPCQRAAFC
mmetsp:Transcript_102258/g.257576  ORF Transcript_102258/g.257576 Transcript_102258/m.257576 type:complete len:259 (-) Transcript_102258:3810-4586(-)